MIGQPSYGYSSIVFFVIVLFDLACVAIFKTLFGHGIVPTLGEGITAQNAPNGQNQSDEKTPFLKCFDRIGRAGWRKPAARRFQRRDKPLVKADEPYHDVLHIG